VKIAAADREGLDEAVAMLRAGEVVAYPTETVYGLAVNPFSELGIRRLFEVKGRPESNPVLLVVANEEQLALVAREISPRARACMETFWPGPLSLVFPKQESVLGLLTGGGDKVCVRRSAHETAQALCEAFGGPITSSSANRSGMPPARSLGDISFPGVSLGIEGGVLPASPPSTVFDPDENRIIREGRIPAAQLIQFAERI